MKGVHGVFNLLQSLQSVHSTATATKHKTEPPGEEGDGDHHDRNDDDDDDDGGNDDDDDDDDDCMFVNPPDIVVLSHR